MVHKMIHFSNNLIGKWPKTHDWWHLHYFLAEAADPPPWEAAYYEELKNITLPFDVRFVAGFVHDKRSEAERQQILETIEGNCGHSVDGACSCGMGRRTPAIAEALIETSHTLTMIRPITFPRPRHRAAACALPRNPLHLLTANCIFSDANVEKIGASFHTSRLTEGRANDAQPVLPAFCRRGGGCRYVEKKA